MRKLNAILSAAILLLFILHGVLGVFQLLGLGTVTLKAITHSMLTLIALHTLIGVKTTADAIRVWRKTGAPYFRQNLLFWARRVSGFAIMILIGFHMTAFSYTVDGAFRLKWFDGLKLATQLLLLVSIAVHVIANVKPMLISFGIRRLKPRTADMLFILSALLLVMAVAFIVYYLRWNAV